MFVLETGSPENGHLSNEQSAFFGTSCRIMAPEVWTPRGGSEFGLRKSGRFARAWYSAFDEATASSALRARTGVIPRDRGVCRGLLSKVPPSTRVRRLS